METKPQKMPKVAKVRNFYYAYVFFKRIRNGVSCSILNDVFLAVCHEQYRVQD